MNILVLQLKRIGDLVLTTPALAVLRRWFPGARITLAVAAGCADLLPAIPGVDVRLAGSNFSTWRRLASGRFDVCFDFTGNDRSAFFALLSGARQRVSFESVKRSRIRALAYNRFVDSAVREHHTSEHYLHLLRGMDGVPPDDETAPLALDVSQERRAKAVGLASGGPFAVVHPGTARSEKYWVPERWAEVIAHVRRVHGLRCVITGGADDFEHAHIAKIQDALAEPCVDLSGKIDLLGFAAVLAEARVCLSCDTAAVHLAAAFGTPQVALFGVTNPFHWRPRHERAVVISAAQPDAPLTRFEPRMRGAAMERIPAGTMIAAVDAVLGGCDAS